MAREVATAMIMRLREESEETRLDDYRAGTQGTRPNRSQADSVRVRPTSPMSEGEEGWDDDR
ncbi:hypothetical protein [Actinomyces timonensis]|uniref:hypothetical protein n=1 Tax=Actinomyces timonensis TaxID=1288391 RepID=UPI0003199BD3|nr:hypothetical protein [Actinomyces timonensis]